MNGTRILASGHEAALRILLRARYNVEARFSARRHIAAIRLLRAVA